MENEKIAEIASVLTGLKRNEWSRVKLAVEKAFDSASAKLELTDAEKLRSLLLIEFISK